MKTAVDKVGRGKERDVNLRFMAMASHYLQSGIVMGEGASR